VAARQQLLGTWAALLNKALRAETVDAEEGDDRARAARAGCAPRGCTVPCTGAARGLAGPGSGPSRPLRSSPHPLHGFYPAYTLTTWLEANRGQRLRLPVVIELGQPGHGFKRSRVGDVEFHVTDLALGVLLSERIAQKCGRDATRCALWLGGRYGEKLPFPDDRPQYEVVKVGDAVDETVELKGERAK
jgi:hypothetical protein